MARKQSAPRLEFEAAAIYEYPEHLRPWLEALPKLPGVYQFHGDSDTMPLYIGKSVNLRSRVLSHLRTPEEAAMLRQSRRITWQRTAGELGALLLEARLIKEQQPLFNKRLRRNKQLCARYLRTTGRRLSMPVRLISRTSSISMACSPTGGRRCRCCRASLTNSASVMACLVWNRSAAAAPAFAPRWAAAPGPAVERRAWRRTKSACWRR